MSKTANLGLNLTEDESTDFSVWRESIDGNGETDKKSNMQIIDEFAGAIYGEKRNDYSFGTEMERRNVHRSSSATRCRRRCVFNAFHTRRSDKGRGRGLIRAGKGWKHNGYGESYAGRRYNDELFYFAR